MRPAPDEVLHFSEDPAIDEFVPHIAATAAQVKPYVWAVGYDRAPDYWFPRQCPRAMAWPGPESAREDVERFLGGDSARVHMIEYRWLKAMRTVQLYVYRFHAAGFVPFGDPPHAMVATTPVCPLGPPEPVGDLFDCHEAAGIELRVVSNLWPWWRKVIDSSLEFSGIRLRNAIT